MAALTLPATEPLPKPRAWESLKVVRRRLAARIMQARVASRDFSIISNDCFGGMAYEELGMRYESPFVGLFIVPEDYVRLLRELRKSVEGPVQFRQESRHEHINIWRANTQRNYPIGMIGDEVELHFVHYQDAATAEAKWRRRAARIHWNKLRVKMGWHEHPHINALLREFNTMPFESRLIVAPHEVPGVRSCIALRDFSTDGTQQYWRAHKAFDVAAWLERGELVRGSWTRVVDWPLYWRY
jgi:uncharacterized protein (DUF1919 family)